MQLNKTTLTKALLALNFVSASLAAGLPGACSDKMTPSSQLLQQIAAQTDSTPEIKAYSFLRLADVYLSSSDEKTVERLYPELGKSAKQSWEWTQKHNLEWWIRDILTGADTKPHSAENSRLATEAIKRALEELKHTSVETIQLDLYLVASQLAKKLGETAESEKCNLAINRALQNCEESKDANPQQIRGCASVCDWMSYQIIPVEPPGEPAFRQDTKYSSPFTEKAFIEAENLKLRGIALVDNLGASNHLRRRAHRDLVFWYKALGKVDKADKQKQLLFGLVGIHDDRILKPIAGSCGHVIWWALAPVSQVMRSCGMG